MDKKLPLWLSPAGDKIACSEKLKVMQQNLDELQQIAQDAYEDGILMGIAPQQLKDFIMQLVANLYNPYE